jgi:hypothetical protein
MRSKALLDSSREPEGCEGSLVNYLYLIHLISGQSCEQ